MNKSAVILIIALLAVIAGEIAYQIAAERTDPVQVDRAR